jgi:DNA-directed RNA polymerase specialized sigma54-like protein
MTWLLRKGFILTKVEKMLQVIHELEPSGVGARDLQECLMLQLKHKTQQSQ